VKYQAQGGVLTPTPPLRTPLQCIVGYLLIQAATIRANIQFCSVWLQNVSRGWPMQAVARLEICTMRINIAFCTTAHYF